MNIDEILTDINAKTGGEYGFALRGSVLREGNLCDLDISYKDGCILGKDKRQELTFEIMKNLPAGYIYNIKFTKNYVTEETVKREIERLVRMKFPALIYQFEGFVEGDPARVIIRIDERLEDYIKTKNVGGEFETALHHAFFSNFKVEFIKDTEFDDLVDDVYDDPTDFEPVAPKTLTVTDVSPLCGELVGDTAGLIKNHKVVTPNAILCGKIKFLKVSDIKKKSGEEATGSAEHEKTAGTAGATASVTESEKTGENADASEKAGESGAQPYVKKYLKFVLEDPTGEINCIYFTTKTTQPAALKLDNNSEIIASGAIEEDKFSGGVTFKIKNINLCIVPKNYEEPVVFKPEPKEYRFCKPEPYIDRKQVDLFSAFNVDDAAVAPYLASHDVVVFDFETTGLSATDCKIIEIGAVKIHNGKITEQFETFVDPEEHIADDSTKIHGIVDSDVAGAPTYQQALADFYKFTRNSTLVAYNIAFDYSFLSKYGREAGYNFDNPQIDALKVATTFVKGVRNYKLKTIADHLGVLLDNAHRAVYDAIATAEVFIKLADHLTDAGL